MADTRFLDGVEDNELDYDSSTPVKFSDFETSTHGRTRESIATSVSKYFKMDSDDDGAPSLYESSPRLQKGEQYSMDGMEQRESVVTFDSSAESTPKKLTMKPRSFSSTPQISSPRGQDLSMVDMKTSWDGSTPSGSNSKAGMLADPAKIAKEREKEERVRHARERLLEERQKKMLELREQQRLAQENREKQLEMRRKKIEDLRRRDIERRQAVEERRKMKEEVERVRRESILQKAEERVARYEAWKAGGRKGGRGHVLGFGSATPRDICQPLERPRRSSSQSALQRRSPSGSDMDSVRPQRRALSACSAVRRHCCVYINRSGTFTSSPVIPAATHHYQRPSNAGSVLSRASMTASLPNPVRMREKRSHKPRPASVASSMPSSLSGELAKSSRSRSSDRTGRDRSKTRVSQGGEKTVKVRESERSQKADQREEKAEEKDQGPDVVKEHGGKKEKKERVSLTFFDRLSAPKYGRKDSDYTSPSKKDVPVIQRPSLREKPSPSHIKDATSKTVPSKEAHRGTTPTNGGSAPVASVRSASPARKEVEKPAIKIASPSHKKIDKTVTTPPPSATSTPTQGPTPALAMSPSPVPAAAVTTQPVADDGTTVPRPAAAPAQDISAEEYKARLAEKRRQARERAEREAEEERRRQEEARLAEEERQRQEEEEEKKFEEEALRVAEEAQRAEEERLQKAIEAEERRRKEEAEKQEQERKAKEEAERRTKLEAERLEKEKQERARKEDEERLERKRKLEMIMKRVKVDTESPAKTEIPPKPVSTFPSVTHLDSSHSSPEEDQEKSEASSEASGDGSSLSVMEGSAVEVYSAAMTMSFMQDMEESSMTQSSSSSEATVAHSMPSKSILDGSSYHDESHGDNVEEKPPHVVDTTPSKTEEKVLSSEPPTESRFRSPLLQQLVENKDSDSGSPKFKSPLLQNLLGKTRIGAHVSSSVSTGDLSRDQVSTPGLAAAEDATSVAPSASAQDSSGAVNEISKEKSGDDVKGEESSVTQPSSSQNSPDEEQEKSLASSDVSSEEGNSLAVMEGSAVEVYSADMTTSFMQDMEEPGMTSSTKLSSAVSHRVTSGSILDEPLPLVEIHGSDTEKKSLDSDSTPSEPEETAVPSDLSSARKPRLESPLLQQSVENREGDSASSSPKFKSPLLQNLLGKTKVGARLGLSASMGDLASGRETTSAQSQPSVAETRYASLSVSSDDSSGSAKVYKQRSDDSDKDEELPVTQPSSSQISPEEEQEKSIASSDVSSEEGNGLPVMEGSAVEVYSSAMTTSFMQDFEEPSLTASTSSSASTVTRSASSGNIIEGSSSSRHDDAEERLSRSADTTPSKSEEKILTSSTESKPRFKSPLLQQLMENRGSDPASGGTRFSSPLIQNLLGKTKVGARLGLSASMGDLTTKKETPPSQSQATATGSYSSLTASSQDSSDSHKEMFTQGPSYEDKSRNQETSGFGQMPFENYAITNGTGRDSGFRTTSSKLSFDSSPFETPTLPDMRTGDPGLGTSSDLHGDPWLMSQSFIFNGHGNHGSYDTGNSRSAFYSVEEGVAKLSPSNPFETLVESERQLGTPPTQGDGHFEELIDLMDTSGRSNSHVAGTPIRAFEESSRRSDVTDYLS